MRFLLIDDDPRYRALLRHHLSCDLGAAELTAHDPVRLGPFEPEFLAQGFSAVLLDHDWEGGSGLDWLPQLTARPGFAPVVFLAPDAHGEIATRAKAEQPFAVLGKNKIDHAALIRALEQAHQQQAKSVAAWRASPEARQQQTFAEAFIPGYRRARRIAAGSVSELFLAESLQVGSMVALKISRDERRADGVDQSFARFLQEYEIVRSIRHPNVVKIIDLGVSDDYAYLVMEYFPGGDLRRRSRGRLPARQAVERALQIAEALQAIHGAGILHRDLKPGNVMLRADGSLALIDFGLAKHRTLELEVTDKGLIFGTPHYMSPEQGHGKPIDARADLYGLGVIFFEMLTGAKPYDADNPMAVIFKHAKHPIPRLPEPVAALQPIVDRLLAKEPDERYPSAAAVAGALLEGLTQLPREEGAA
jgi:tRNA A-37 threonylcarbamoyl transferase component Bud32/CheY-like chemotaxis protein